MPKNILCSLLACALALPVSAAPLSDQAIGNLLEAFTVGGAVYDGGHAVPAPAQAVRGAPAKPPAPLAPAGSSKQETPAAAPTPADVQPSQAHGISDGYLGLYKEKDFVIGTGRCSGCRAPEQGKWYFLDEVIATPKAGTPALIWIGAHELIEGVTLSEDGKEIMLQDGTFMPFALVDKIPLNRSYYDASSLAYFKQHTLRMRGEYAMVNGVKTFVARTIWPEDYRIEASSLKEGDAKSKDDIDNMIGADKGGAKKPFQSLLLWKREGGDKSWEGKPVMGVMLNGAQGDDDEALAGHFSMFTGRMGPNGSMADWMFDNFYDMNQESEKGIVASMVPMDKYMTDLNSGQSWYRPSYVLVMIMKDGRVPEQVQEMFKTRYAQYYAQDFKYNHTNLNCTALITDPVRGLGWKYPENGKTPKPIAKSIAFLAAKLSGNKKAGDEIYASLREEPIRSFPRAAFVSAGGDLLSMQGAFGAEPIGRELSPLEKMMHEDIEAVVWVRMPQIPSSRKWGRDAVGGVMDYLTRTGGKIKQVVPVPDRPFPPPH
ncbi:MAG: hypothetical protein HY077_10715 [Elusimicrobia bacterium]|nr:hypothetical protein [Elusimicrobiota bacterium]